MFLAHALQKSYSANRHGLGFEDVHRLAS